MTLPVIALLGRKDEPTDAVEEYCRYLASALHAHEIDMQIRRVPWEKHGWRESLKVLKLMAADWRGKWVILQYTALAWSSRGFPLRFLRVLEILKAAGARVGVVFHDVEPFPGSRLTDLVRRRVQVHVMRRALKAADLAVLTVPLYKLSWLPFTPINAVYTDPFAPSRSKISLDTFDRHGLKSSSEGRKEIEARNGATDNPSPLQRKCHFLPVGPNLPITERQAPHASQCGIPVIGVFSITGGETGSQETQTIIVATRSASEKLGRLRLAVFGRNAESREHALKDGLQGAEIDLSVEGVLTQEEIVQRIRSCDVLLFVRGGISTRRSSAIAGISCGVPMVAFVGPETSWPFQDCGVVLVSPANLGELVDGLIYVLSDAKFREGMALANKIAYEEHFAWTTIAARFASLLKGQKTNGKAVDT